jgi:hypothetical protein
VLFPLSPARPAFSIENHSRAENFLATSLANPTRTRIHLRHLSRGTPIRVKQRGNGLATAADITQTYCEGAAFALDEPHGRG